MPRPLLTCLAAVAAVSVAGCGGGSSSSAPPEAWAATLLSAGCPRGPGALPRSSCRLLLIDGPGVPPLHVELRVIDPDPGVALQGTVLFGSGGFGDFFYGENPGGPELFAELSALGFRVVDRAWQSGWWLSGSPFLVQSRRFATLLAWVRDNLHTGGTFCAVGASAGSGELAYALTTWGLADLLDAAVFTSGPAMTRLDWVCEFPAIAAWETRCTALYPAGIMSCGAPTCALSENSEGIEVCSVPVPNRSAQALHDDSVLHPRAVVSFPVTRVAVVIGADDCSNAAISGLLFHDEVQSEKVLELAPGTPHIVVATQAGRDAIVRAVLGAMAGWSGPATLSAEAWPATGRRLDVQVHGRPGEVFEVFASPSTGCVELPALGRWLLGEPWVCLGGGVLRGTDGRARFSSALPDDPALEGGALYVQAWTGSRVTNAIRVAARH